MRVASRIALSCAAVLVVVVAAQAEVVEAPFAPSVGSRWTVEDVDDGVTSTPGGKRETQLIRQSGELVVKEKTPTGFVVTFEVKDVEISGDASGVAVVGPALKEMKGVVFEGELDASGKPVAMRNLEAVKARMREIVERAAKPFEDKPKLAELMRSMLTQLLVLDGPVAAETYFQPLMQMSRAQNLGLKAGEAKEETTSTPNPLGGDAIKTIAVTRLAKRDPATGVTVFTRLERFDNESLKTAVMAITRRIMRDAGVAPAGLTEDALADLAKRIEMSSDTVTTYDVRGGMTRRVEQNSVMRASAMGQRFSKDGKRVVTIEPAR